LLVLLPALLTLGALPTLNFSEGGRRQLAELSAVVRSLLYSEALPRLVIEARGGLANEPLPLGISIEHGTGTETVTITGLTAGTELSLGSFSEPGWSVAASDLDQTFIGPPRNFVGAMHPTVTLRSASGRLLDQQTLRLEWSPRTEGPAASAAQPTVSAAAQRRRPRADRRRPLRQLRQSPCREQQPSRPRLRRQHSEMISW
jgi:hypothetical protein